jgi:hypothetical protein
VVPFIVEYEPPIAPLLTITLSPVPAPAGPTAGGQKVSGVVTLAQPAALSEMCAGRLPASAKGGRPCHGSR